MPSARYTHSPLLELSTEEVAFLKELVTNYRNRFERFEKTKQKAEKILERLEGELVRRAQNNP